ncbi:MAG: response regulator [Planctomycetaceae bacterium]|jgi:CheY-like chemotaxis protein|nr:response regulator [Planctomycetaceae bacterium]
MKYKILIADDNIINVELLEAYLASANYKNFDYEIITALDGAETLEKANSEMPDLILLDIMMPKMSGFEVCEKIRSNPKTNGIMILMVTALSELGDIERAVVAGCDDYLSKPVNKFELVKRVENMLKLHSITNELERLKQYINEMEK